MYICVYIYNAILSKPEIEKRGNQAHREVNESTTTFLAMKDSDLIWKNFSNLNLIWQQNSQIRPQSSHSIFGHKSSIIQAANFDINQGRIIPQIIATILAKIRIKIKRIRISISYLMHPIHHWQPGFSWDINRAQANSKKGKIYLTNFLIVHTSSSFSNRKPRATTKTSFDRSKHRVFHSRSKNRKRRFELVTEP